MVFTMLCALAPSVSVSAATSGHYRDLGYEINNGIVTITDCNESATNVDIPSEIDGLPVTLIGDNAFDDCTGLTDGL